MVRSLTTHTATSPCIGHREQLLLHARPVIRIVWGVGRLRHEHDLARRIMFEETGVYASVGVCIVETIQGSSSWDMLQFTVVQDTERHGKRWCLARYSDRVERYETRRGERRWKLKSADDGGYQERIG